VTTAAIKKTMCRNRGGSLQDRSGTTRARACRIAYTQNHVVNAHRAQPAARSNQKSRIACMARTAFPAAIPLIGLFELFRVDEPPERKSLRLLIAFVSAVVLALSAFIREYLERHDLTADLSTAVLQRTRVEEERLELSGRLIHAQEEERSRIGRELHDDLNQRLGLLAFGLVQLLGSAPAEAKNSIHQLHEQTNNLSKDVHCLSHELHPVALEQLGLVVAARAFCGDFSKQQKMRVEFTEENILAQLAPDVSLCLFRILQESLTMPANMERPVLPG